MTSAVPPRSAASAAASRSNGAQSKGPRTETGKAASAQNARKHGLFAVGGDNPGEFSPETAQFARYIAELTAGRPDLAPAAREVVVAAVRAERAQDLLEEIRSSLAALLGDDAHNAKEARNLLGQVARIGRYQRRFRGQRDRALRAIIKAVQPDPRRFRRADDGTFAPLRPTN